MDGPFFNKYCMHSLMPESVCHLLLMSKVNLDKLDKMTNHGAYHDPNRKVTGNFAFTIMTCKLCTRRAVNTSLLLSPTYYYDSLQNATAGNLFNMYIDSNCFRTKILNQDKNNAKVNSFLFTNKYVSRDTHKTRCN